VLQLWLIYRTKLCGRQGDALNSRCASGICRSSDKKCVECLVTNDCSSNKVCHTDNKCYSSGLSYEDACAADNGDAIDDRCVSGICHIFFNNRRMSQEALPEETPTVVVYFAKICGCTNDSHCPSNQACNSDDNKCYPYLRIFVTSKTYKGNLGGASGADDKCQDLANLAGLDGTFKAWLSQSTTDSPAESWSHAIPNRPYYLVDDTTKVADDWNHLTNAVNNELHHPINKNEDGQTVNDALRVWTNTKSNGNRVPNSANCGGWTNNSNNKSGKYGRIDATNNNWSWAGGMNCNWLGRLYCIQQNTNT